MLVGGEVVDAVRAVLDDRLAAGQDELLGAQAGLLLLLDRAGGGDKAQQLIDLHLGHGGVAPLTAAYPQGGHGVEVAHEDVLVGDHPLVAVGCPPFDRGGADRGDGQRPGRPGLAQGALGKRRGVVDLSESALLVVIIRLNRFVACCGRVLQGLVPGARAGLGGDDILYRRLGAPQRFAELEEDASRLLLLAGHHAGEGGHLSPVSKALRVAHEGIG